MSTPRKLIDVSQPTTPSTPLSDFFTQSLREFDSIDEPLADVSIARGVEIIRADRDGRADNA